MSWSWHCGHVDPPCKRSNRHRVHPRLSYSSAVVPRARVSARTVSTGFVVTTETNSTGFYFVGELRPGTNEVEVQSQGFQRFVQRCIPLRAEDRLRLDIRLTVGQVSETVEVKADAP